MTDAITIRRARRDDARAVAELFSIASDGVAEYLWSTFQADHPGLSLIEIGARRYARENTPFSYQHCRVAEAGGRVVGMVHGFVMPPADPDAETGNVDPVLAPYAALEVPGSFYISAIALLPGFRGQGIGARFLEMARDAARAQGCPQLSLGVFDANDGARRLYARHGFREIARATVVPHALIHVTGEVILMVADVEQGAGV